MSSDLTSATRTFRYPFSRRSDNRAITAAGAIASQFLCFGFPHSVVPVIRSYECVPDFVEDCVTPPHPSYRLTGRFQARLAKTLLSFGIESYSR
jgi:hypothetical protein